MAVVPRKRRSGKVVYYVATSWEGGQHWEKIGTNKREAESIDAKRLKEVAAGTFRPGQLTGASTFKAYAARWLAGRTNRSRANDRALLERHVLTVEAFASLPMGDIRPRHVLELIRTLRSGALAEKSVALIMGIIRVLFRDAVIDETIMATPYVVPRGTLTRDGEVRQPYTAEEAAALMAPGVGEREQVWNTLAFYTGARCGEICGLRWGDWNETAAPLGALTFERQYGGEGEDGTTKTGRARVVAVHPWLALVLSAWRARYSLYHLRRPGPNDPIVPSPSAAIAHQSKSSAYKAWLRSCEKAGVKNRSVHSSRHTFITLALRAGAPEKTVVRLTHNPKGSIIDVYNHRDWAEFCDAVLALQYPHEIDAALDATRDHSVIQGSSSWTRSRAEGGNTGKAGNEPSESGSKNAGEETNPALADAWLDARQVVKPVDALALAAERMLGRSAVHWVTVRRRKGGQRDAG